MDGVRDAWMSEFAGRLSLGNVFTYVCEPNWCPSAHARCTRSGEASMDPRL